MARGAITKATLNRAGATFQIDGVQESLAKIAKVIDRTKAENLKDIFYSAGTILRDQARINQPPPRTGRLFNATQVVRGTPNKPNVLVRVNRHDAPEGLWLEYGTTKMAARPFFRKAIVSTRPQMALVIITGIQRQIEDATA